MSNSITITRSYKHTRPTIPQLRAATQHVSHNTIATGSYTTHVSHNTIATGSYTTRVPQYHSYTTRVPQYHSYVQLQHVSHNTTATCSYTTRVPQYHSYVQLHNTNAQHYRMVKRMASHCQRPSDVTSNWKISPAYGNTTEHNYRTDQTFQHARSRSRPGHWIKGISTPLYRHKSGPAVTTTLSPRYTCWWFMFCLTF